MINSYIYIVYLLIYIYTHTPCWKLVYRHKFSTYSLLKKNSDILSQKRRTSWSKRRPWRHNVPIYIVHIYKRISSYCHLLATDSQKQGMAINLPATCVTNNRRLWSYLHTLLIHGSWLVPNAISVWQYLSSRIMFGLKNQDSPSSSCFSFLFGLWNKIDWYINTVFLAN